MHCRSCDGTVTVATARGSSDELAADELAADFGCDSDSVKSSLLLFTGKALTQAQWPLSRCWSHWHCSGRRDSSSTVTGTPAAAALAPTAAAAPQPNRTARTLRQWQIQASSSMILASTVLVSYCNPSLVPVRPPRPGQAGQPELLCTQPPSR